MYPESHDVRERLKTEAVGFLPDRRSTPEAGADDLETLHTLAGEVGSDIDQTISRGEPDRILALVVFSEGRPRQAATRDECSASH